MTIYLDVIFLENFFMNYIILFAVGYITKAKLKQTLLIISSILGSGYATFVYMQDTYFYSNIIIKIVLSIVMVFVAFIPKNFKKIFQELIMFYLISFLFGGCALSLLYFIKPENIIMKKRSLCRTLSTKNSNTRRITGIYNSTNSV